MAATVFNEAQLELLKMMSLFNTPEAVSDLKQAISNYFAEKANLLHGSFLTSNSRKD